MIKLSILIPVLNEEKTVEKSIQNILDMNLKDYEVIIIDNGSNDRSVDIIKGYKKFNNFKFIFRKQNLGYGSSVKEFAKIAKGEFLFIQYSDLEYNHKRLPEMLSLCEKSKLDAVFGNRFEKNLNFLEYINLIKKKKAYLATIITTYLVNKFYNYNLADIIGMKFYRKSSFLDLDIKSDHMGFDFELVSKMCKKNYKIGEILVEYVPRFKNKKIRFYHMIPAIYEILKCRFYS